jgi:hypothetical protein
VAATVQVGMEHQAAASLQDCAKFGGTHSACAFEGYLPLESCGAIGKVLAVMPVYEEKETGRPDVYLIDADPGTVWESQNGIQNVKLVFDLKEVRRVGMVIIKWAGHDSARQVKISAGSSCTSLTVVAEVSHPPDSSTWDDKHALTFETAQARIFVLELSGLQEVKLSTVPDFCCWQGSC